MSLNRVRTYIHRFDPELEPVLFEKKLMTSQEAADTLKVELGQIAKSMLFQSKTTHGLFVTAGDQRIDSKKIKTMIGRKPKLAPPETVKAMTGFEVGAVCPFGLLEAIPIYIDHTLKRFPLIYTAAGVPESMLPLSFEQLVAMTDGTVCDFVMTS